MSWTDEQVAILEKLSPNENISYEVIGKRVGKSRNAVAGKIHRLGLPVRGGNWSRKRKAQSRKNASKRSASRKVRYAPPPKTKARIALESIATPDPFVPTVDELVIPLAERKTMETLGRSDCKWPIGDPKFDPGFHFCGKSRVTGLPYCEHHARRAFQPPNVQQRKTPRRVPVVEAFDSVNRHVKEIVEA